MLDRSKFGKFDLQGNLKRINIFEKWGSVNVGKRDGKVISHQITKKSRNNWDLLYKFMAKGRAQK